MSNIYYNPEAYGLETVGEVEWGDGCYSFDLTVIWKDAEGVYYWESDSGCSCPTPFESFSSAQELESGTAHDAVAELQARQADNQYDRSADVATLVERIMSA